VDDDPTRPATYESGEKGGRLQVRVLVSPYLDVALDDASTTYNTAMKRLVND